jgi:hypothetical protein
MVPFEQTHPNLFHAITRSKFRAIFVQIKFQSSAIIGGAFEKTFRDNKSTAAENIFFINKSLVMFG